jgi:hypothetical protein
VASVDDLTFRFLSGNAEPTRLVVQDITRPGVNGHAYRQDALRGPQFEIDRQGRLRDEVRRRRAFT